MQQEAQQDLTEQGVLPYLIQAPWSVVLFGIQNIHSKKSSYPPSDDRHESSLHLAILPCLFLHALQQFYYLLALIHTALDDSI